MFWRIVILCAVPWAASVFVFQLFAQGSAKLIQPLLEQITTIHLFPAFPKSIVPAWRNRCFNRKLPVDCLLFWDFKQITWSEVIVWVLAGDRMWAFWRTLTFSSPLPKPKYSVSSLPSLTSHCRKLAFQEQFFTTWWEIAQLSSSVRHVL